MDDIYLALDFPKWEEANDFLIRHDLQGVPVKIGMELFYQEGPDLIKRLKANNHPIFLDLKLHDIPMTVYKTMKNLGKLNVDLVNVHALGGLEMMKRAREGLSEGSQSGTKSKLLAVTLLTSLNNQVLTDQLFIKEKLVNYVVHLATLTKQSGCDGVVCSVHEVEGIKEACGSEFLTVTPGIRLAGSEQHDQTRTATPKNAKALGADKLVIGRTITMSQNPGQTYKQILKEWNYGSQ